MAVTETRVKDFLLKARRGIYTASWSVLGLVFFVIGALVLWFKPTKYWLWIALFVFFLAAIG